MAEPEPTLLYTVEEMAKVLRISRARAYLLCQRRQVPTVRIGRSVRIRHDHLMAWLGTLDRPVV